MAETQGLSHVRTVIAVASGKGGVGKSTIASHLAVALKKRGAKVGLLDADIYGPSQGGMLGSKNVTAETSSEGSITPVDCYGVKTISVSHLMKQDGPLIWRAPIAMKLIHELIEGVEWGSLDYLIVDLPPGTGDVQLTLAQQARLAGAIIVTTPQDVALGIAKKGLQMFLQLNVPILGVVENMSGFECEKCHHQTHIFKHGGGKKLASTLSVPYLGAIPLDPAIVEASDSGIPVFEKNPNSTSAKTMMELAQNVERQLKDASAEGLEPKNMNLTPRNELSLSWSDGKNVVIPAFILRTGCGCANCVDENTGKRVLDPAKIPLDIKIDAFKAVGRYGVGISFSDGHNTGIYPYERLKQMNAAPSGGHSFTV